ncbi:hypothetical protein Afil01_31250 [Actinorhabdospora filicis]|uniref:Uncharacterized protein n=1 Tax=Actinorhabdospora filicis TaxID=1785913 RepID=A0A9W6SL99_9ACTN|nr:hypothetical protein [Actinorhabdospora filicis]GLZ78318.1 hypothetical protein Afil01_31250 [Actinorhabdospora filicis]
MDASPAVDWIHRHGRAIDQRCVSVELGTADTAVVAEALGAFQNPDGGFGHALEPDVRRAGSSVLATTIALQLLARYGLGGNVDLLDGARRFLTGTYEPGTAAWPIVPAEPFSKY